MKRLLTFSGNSKSIVELIEVNGSLRVRKTHDIHRNLAQLSVLKDLGFDVPEILEIAPNYYEMEYIPHIDVKSLLLAGNVVPLVNFLVHTFSMLSSSTDVKDYSEIYHSQLNKFPWIRFRLPFDKEQLIQNLPKVIPSSSYHGDFTLENILYGKNGKFYLLDPLSSPYDSFVFDLAKLRQDITCKWFTRNDNVFVDSKLKMIDSVLSRFEYYSNDSLVILMLMRVLPYVTKENDQLFLEKEISKLWK